MKITEDILKEIGFELNPYNKLLYIIVDNITIFISNNNDNLEIWELFYNGTHPSLPVLTVLDIINIVSSKAINIGKIEKQNEIKKILGL